MTVPSETAATPAPRDALRRRLEITGQILVASLLVLHPAVSGWLPPFADGRATMAVNLADLLLLLPACLLLPLAATCLALRRERLSRLQALPFLFLGLFLLWTLLQTLPLPASLVALLSPNAAAIRKASAPFADPALLPSTLSLVPHDTRIALLRGLAAFAGFLGAFAFVRSRRDLLRIVIPAVAAGATLALLGTLKATSRLAAGRPVLPFLFPAGSEGARASGPFTSANQFAGLLEILFPFAVALVLLVRHSARREDIPLRVLLSRFSSTGARMVLAALAALLMAGGILLSQSRLGILAFAASALLLVLLLVRSLEARWRAAGAAAALVIVFFAYLGMEPVLDRYALLMEEGKVDRFKAWSMGVEIAADFPVTGTGLGTFRRVSPHYQPADLKGGYHQAHNDYVNAASDAGFPGLVLLLAAAGTFVVVAARGLRAHGVFRPAFAAAGIASAGALAVHSAGDFNLQVASLAFLAAACAGLSMAAAGLPARGSTPLTESPRENAPPDGKEDAP